MVEIISLEIELRSLVQQLQNLIIYQNNRVEEFIELNARDLVLYDLFWQINFWVPHVN
jgi:hypothetical protein